MQAWRRRMAPRIASGIGLLLCTALAGCADGTLNSIDPADDGGLPDPGSTDDAAGESEASPEVSDGDSDAGPPDAEVPDAEVPDSGDPTRCDPLTCSGIAGHYCAAGLCIAGTWSDVAFAEGHACILLGAPGPVHCLGENDRGQLGDGTRNPSRRFVRVAGIDDAERVFVGRRHSCAVTHAGAIRCWGANEVGQCGTAGGEDALAATSIEAAATSATQLALGADHTCLRLGGEVRCFGGNGEGQLADGTRSGRPAMGEPIATDAIAIGAGDATTCVLASGGIVSCAGLNDQGQVGGAAGESVTTLTAVAAGESFESFGVGDAFACAVTAAGVVRCWGANDRGQLGVGAGSPEGVVMPTLADPVLTLAIGARHAIVIDSTTSSWAWGDNEAGQIGFGGVTEPATSTPRRLSFVVAQSVVTGGTTTWGKDGLGEYFFGGLADELREP
jgi:alpha-tubulin suppressor-like RCC1 family protein